jgi:hypothetical protein
VVVPNSTVLAHTTVGAILTSDHDTLAYSAGSRTGQIPGLVTGQTGPICALLTSTILLSTGQTGIARGEVVPYPATGAIGSGATCGAVVRADLANAERTEVVAHDTSQA